MRDLGLRLGWILGLIFVLGGLPVLLLAQSADAAKPSARSSLQIEFTNVNLQPPHWKLQFDESGAGLFDADVKTADVDKEIVAGEVHRPVQLSSAFVARAFATARSRRYFDFPCESHMKVAYQGTKKLSYVGPYGSGSCEYNYSKDKDIQSLGDSLMAVEATLLSGARLEKLLLHDRLGLDRELDDLVAAAHDGNAIELGTIKNTLTRIASDEQVLERARRKARLLLAQAS